MPPGSSAYSITASNAAVGVAGAARDDLLQDLRDAVDSASAEGTTLETFRERFDDVVARRGWQYRGGRDWRTRVIYETNLRSSYAAGRWQQLQVVKERRPYWRYRHSEASEHPRHEHVAWDGLVLSADDDWWRTHYPPNGWGCKCYVEALSDRDLRRMGKDGPDTAPAVRTRTVTVGSGDSARTVEAPEGIDPGWGYAPGRESALGEAVRRRLAASARQSSAIGAAGAAAALERPAALAALAEKWRDWRRRDTGAGRQAEAMEVGAVPPDALDALRRRGVEPATAAISVARRELTHLQRGPKEARGQALSDADMDRLPEILAEPEAVLLEELPGGNRGLLFVFEPADPADRRKGKWFVKVDARVDERREGGRRRPYRTNSIRSGGYVQSGDLRDPRYALLTGRVE